MYKCLKSFKTAKGNVYYYGSTIHFSEYNNLAPYEKRYFELQVKQQEEEIERIRVKQREEDARRKREEEEDAERMRLRRNDEDFSTTFPNFTPAYDMPDSGYDSTSSSSSDSSNDSSPDYGGGDSGGAGSSGDFS